MSEEEETETESEESESSDPSDAKRKGLRFIFDDFPEELGITDIWHLSCLSADYWGCGKVAYDKNGDPIYKIDAYFETIPAAFSHLIQEIVLVSPSITLQMSDALLFEKIDLMQNLISITVSKMNRACSIFGFKMTYDIGRIRETLGRSEADWLEASQKRFEELKESEKRFKKKSEAAVRAYNMSRAKNK